MKNRKNRALLAVAAVFALLLAAGTAVLPGCRGETPRAAAKAVRWQCPMHPEVIKDGPGDCPICNMKLVPMKTEAEAGGKEPSAASPAAAPAGPAGLAVVTIDPDKARLLGLKTVAVTRGPIATSIRTVGRVAFDERRVHHVHTRYEAYVEHTTADFTGKYVHKGEVLAEVYSPELFSTQQEYLLALRASRSLKDSTLPSVSQGGSQLLDAARQKLLLWQISPDDIAAIEKKGEPLRTVNIYAPISGYVVARTAFHGMKVMPADSLFDIVDLSSVWVIADVYEYELPRLSVGQHAEMTLSYWPDRKWSGSVTYVYPSVDEKTRTVKVRLEVANPNGDLKPEMFAEVVIRGRSREVLRVPEEAVLESGTRNVVFLAPGEGRLVPREVRLGDHVDGMYEVVSGLLDGDVVALGANFLVDSESRLKSALSAMATSPATAGAPK